jgi:hypothetical protein
VFAETDGPGVAVNRPVPNLENRHAETSIPFMSSGRETTIAALRRKHVAQPESQLPELPAPRMIAPRNGRLRKGRRALSRGSRDFSSSGDEQRAVP